MEPKALTYEFEVPLSGWALIHVTAETEEEARRLLKEGVGHVHYKDTEFDFQDADLLAVMDEDGEEI